MIPPLISYPLLRNQFQFLPWYRISGRKVAVIVLPDVRAGLANTRHFLSASYVGTLLVPICLLGNKDFPPQKNHS